jgi:hypothetical protein
LEEIYGFSIENGEIKVVKTEQEGLSLSVSLYDLNIDKLNLSRGKICF